MISNKIMTVKKKTAKSMYNNSSSICNTIKQPNNTNENKMIE